MIHSLVLYCNVQPGYDEVIYHHVEYRRGYKSALRYNPCGGEGRSVEAVLSWHHLSTVPEGLQDSTYTRDRSIPLQCDEKALLVHGIIDLPEVQEYQEEGVLLYSGKLLGKI